MSLISVSTSARLFGGVAATAAATLMLVGCSSGGDSDANSKSDQDSAAAASSAINDAISGGGDGRVFNSSDDTMVKAATAATGAESGEWRDDTLRLTFSKGSKEDVIASINCRAIAHTLADDDGLVLIYPDGEVDCGEQE